MNWADAIEFQSETRSWLAIQKAWAQALIGYIDQVESTLQPTDEVKTMLGTIAAARAYCANLQGNTHSAAKYAREALELLPNCSSISRSIRSVATSRLGDASRINGNLGEAAHAYTEAVRIGQEANNLHMVIIANSNLADILMEQGRLHRALPPWHYAEVVKTIIPALRRSRRSPSLWVPVIAPGKWYFEEIKYTLRNPSIAVAVTQGQTIPRILDFSKPPGLYNAPCSGPESADPQPFSDLTEKAIRSLLVMARFTAAYTNEVASSLILGEWASRHALKTLVERGFIEYHPNDGDIDSHLRPSKKKKERDRAKSGMEIIGPIGRSGGRASQLPCAPGEFPAVEDLSIAWNEPAC